MPILSLAAMDKLLRKGGAQRVSDGAKKALSEVLEELADKIAHKAAELAKHSGRTTVKESDIKLASKT